MMKTEQRAIEQIMLSRPESFEELIDEISPEVYGSLKTAIEIGKWADGRRLDAQQLDTCLQAVILYEAKHLPEQDRIGFDLSASCQSKSGSDQMQAITVGDGTAASVEHRNKS